MADFTAGFLFDGVDSIADLGVKLEKFSLPTAPTMSDITEDIPGKYGTNYEGTNFQSKNITFTIYIDGQNDKHRMDAILQNVRDNLIRFNPSNPNQEYPLTFNFAPNVTYMGHFSQIGDPQLINNAWWARVQLTFAMSDPRAYLPQVRQELTDLQTEVNVEGSAEADPVISIIPHRDLKFVGYNLNGEYMGLGADADDQQSSIQQKYVNAINDNAGTMTPWTQDKNAIAPITTGVFKFTPQGTFASNTDVSSLTVGRKQDGSFDFGDTVEEGWYGPLMRYEGLTQALTDFRVEVMLHHKKYYGPHNLRAMGDVEFLLLDPSGRTFGRMAIKDQSGGHVPIVYFQIGKPGSHFGGDDSGTHDYHSLYYGKGVNFTDKRNQTVKVPYTVKSGKKTVEQYINVENAENTSAITNGWLKFTLEREGNVYNWSIHQYSLYTGEPYQDPATHLIVSGTYVDNDNEYTSKLGSFGLAFWKDALTEDLHNVPYRNAYLSLTDLQVYKVNSIKNDMPEYVANAGQEVVFDSANDIVTVDGVQKYPVWVSDYPKLKPGKNMLDIVGDVQDADLYLTYNPRLK